MNVYEVEHVGSLTVAWLDCYQHPEQQHLKDVKPGNMIVVLTGQEFQRFKQRMM